MWEGQWHTFVVLSQDYVCSLYSTIEGWHCDHNSCLNLTVVLSFDDIGLIESYDQKAVDTISDAAVIRDQKEDSEQIVFMDMRNIHTISSFKLYVGVDDQS